MFRDLHNIREGWARPDDPQRARLCTPDHADLHAARLLRWGRKPGRNQREENRQAVHDHVLTLLEQGKIRTREDIIQALQASSKNALATTENAILESLATSAPAAGLWGRYSAVPVGWPSCGAVQS